MKRATWRVFVLLIVFSILLSISGCNLPGMTTSDPGLEATRIALGIESTMLVMQQQTLEAQQNAPTNMPTYTPYPTYTPELPQVTETTEPVAVEAPEEPAPVVDMQERIKSANILIYEDLRGDPELLPYVHETINRMGFSGGKIVEVNDAVGNFKDQLLSSTKWDLIIVASEARGSIRGEFWEYILTHVNNDVGLIVEMWYLDEIANGKIDGVLSKCGVRFQKNWNYGSGGNPLDYSIYMLDPNSDVLNKPNTGISLSNPSYFYWNPGDVGDLVRVGTGGDATIVAGLYPQEKSNYGLITTCLEGRMVLQTFDTHDYDPSMTKALWENYITFTLTNHFNKIDQ
ncbi:MAG: hypothetical protein JEZ00_18620 [Anaerolineaceae bacterium]|nr:hypothetical protein [Anaerolineaceae bacterium]